MDSNKEVKRRRDRPSDNEDFIKVGRSKKRRSRSRSRNDDRTRESWRKRNRSRSKSPGVSFKRDRRRDDATKDVSSKHEEPTVTRKVKETDMLNTRTGGAYIPPARLRLMQAQITDKSSVAYQRLAWEALKKSIHGHINKINVGNIGIIIKQLLKENIVRGRGLLCRSVIQAQAASPTFTNVYAALVSAVNSRFPNIGELLLKRLVIQFKRGFKRNDKAICISSASFIAHLVNQKVAHEIVALELLTLLVETPTDDSVEVSIAFLKECGQKLTEVSSKGVNAIFEMLRNILHEGKLDKRVQYMIEVVFQVWKDGFKDHPAVIEELELVPEEEQFTHLLMLDDATNAQDILNVFKFDDKYEENEQKYKALCGEILGSDAESGEEGDSGESGSEESEEEDEKQKEVTIIDNTETNLVALRRTIYLTINSSLDFEECAHKLMKMQLKPGQEVELCHMFLDCCAEQRTYEKFYGLLAQRFCNINRIYISPFEEIFKDSYSTAHRLDTNRLRNVSKFFAHLLFTDSISWEALDCVKLNEEDTTSSSRIYIKILFQELAEYMGLKKLNDRLKDPTLQQAFSGIFPRDNPKNSRFSINFFTSIGLGGLTDELREHLKQMPKNVPPQITEINIDSDSSSDSSSSSSESSSSSSDSSSSESETEKKRNEKKVKKNSKNKTPKTPELETPPKDKESDKTERWGHDGFYDTYGQDARRNESNSGRPVRSKDTLSKNRHDIRNNYEDRYKNYEQENDREYSNRNRGREERPIRSFEDKGRAEKNDRREKRLRNIDSNDKYNDNDPRRSRNDRDSRRDRDQRSGRYEREIENIDRRSQEKDSRRDKDDQRSKRYEREDETSRHRDVRKDREKDNYPINKNNEDDLDRTRNDRESRREKEEKNERENSRRNRDMHEDKEKDKNRDKTTKTKFVEGELKKSRDEIKSQKGREEQTDTHNERSIETTRSRETRNNLEGDAYMSNKKNKEVLESGRYDRESRRDKENKKNKRHRSKSLEDIENVSENDGRNKSNKVYEDENREDQYISNRKHKEDKYEKVKKAKSNGKDHGKYESSDEVTKESKRSEDSKSKKRSKNSKKQKENVRNDTDSGTDQSNSDDSKDKQDLGGRYWDNFDIDSKSGKEKENESFEARTPEKNEKYYERKRER